MLKLLGESEKASIRLIFGFFAFIPIRIKSTRSFVILCLIDISVQFFLVSSLMYSSLLFIGVLDHLKMRPVKEINNAKKVSKIGRFASDITVPIRV